MTTDPNTARHAADLAAWLEATAGVRIHTDQHGILHGRAAAAAARLGLSVPDLLAALRRRDPKLVAIALDTLTIKETSWFRDRHPFDAIASTVIPEAIARNAASRRLSIWSAAASTGQELYSLALLLIERFPQLATWTLDLVGTDVSPGALDKARSGRYSQLEVDRGLPASMMVDHFTRDGAYWRLSGNVTSRCRFEATNLITDPAPRPASFDLIMCRYVLIYFQESDRAAVVRKLARALRPGGALFLGASEIAHPYVTATLQSRTVDRATWLQAAGGPPSPLAGTTGTAATPAAPTSPGLPGTARGIAPGTGSPARPTAPLHSPIPPTSLNPTRRP